MDQIEAFEWESFVRKIQDHFRVVRTQEQHEFIDEWCKRHRTSWGVFWNTKLHCVVLRTIRTSGQNGLDGRYYYIPFDENSTTEDVQKFVDLLKVADVHEC